MASTPEPDSASPCPPVPDRLPWPVEDRPLLAFLPMVYIAWADGELTDDEIESIQRSVDSGLPLDERSQDRLRRWLDPDNPPPAKELNAMLRLIRQAGAGLERDQRIGLAGLGRRLADLSAEAGDGDGALAEDVGQALETLEGALGLVGEEAARAILEDERAAPPTPEEEPAAFDVATLTATLDGRHHDLRNRLRAVLSRPDFAYVHGLPKEEYREKVLAWCHLLADEGFGALAFPEDSGGSGDLAAFIAVFETLGMHDTSLAVKFGVQFGLFGGSILMLGTEKHHRKYLAQVGSLDLPGCFAMSEVGHGSNVRDVDTVVRFDRETGELVIHTPDPMARKQWIGNAAAHGRMATVFAQLEIDGESQGVHAFLVPIRDEKGQALPGVTLEDSGLKGGLNGVDNGLIGLDHVRIPRDNLLDRFASVDAEGHYTSPIPGAAKRFFTMLGTLVGGRISVGASALTGAKVGLAIAVRYAARRRQFGPAGGPEVRILDYLTHQRRLMPRVATAYALSFALAELRERFVDAKEAGEKTRELETLAAGLKARASRFSVDTLQECREACGGQGYLEVNRLTRLRADFDIFTTFEGDNTVLQQLVAKGVLTQFRQQFEGFRAWNLVRHLAHRAAAELTEANPVVARRTDEDHLRDPEFQLSAFRFREEKLVWSAAGRLKARIDDGMDSFEAFNEVQDHLVTMAEAYVERVVLESFVRAVEACEDADVQAQLRLVCQLHALWQMDRNRDWFLKNGVIESGKASAIRALVNKLCGEVRRQAVPLVDAFGIPDEVLAAPIAFREGAV